MSMLCCIEILLSINAGRSGKVNVGGKERDRSRNELGAFAEW